VAISQFQLNYYVQRGISTLSELNQLILHANYNQLMNDRLYKAASRLTKEELNTDNKSFFKSVLGTLNHIIVGDIIWLKRLAKSPSSTSSLRYVLEFENPKSLSIVLFKEFDKLKEERHKFDDIIIDWVFNLSEADINQCISYTNMAGVSFSKPFASLINHLFLHQVHHRGQVTTLLSQYGVNFGETDIIEIINECNTKPAPQ
jgi:uncharacterized damage-inducible protein DinB